MNQLTVKTTIFCNTCGCAMKRSTAISVEAQDKESAIEEAKEKAQKWQKSLEGQNCKICKSILKSVAK